MQRRMKTHPIPTTPHPRSHIIGWFDLAFEGEPDHWYTFNVYNNGLIVPSIANPDDVDPETLLTFIRFLSDTRLIMVQYTQNSENATPDVSKRATVLPPTITRQGLGAILKALNPSDTMRE